MWTEMEILTSKLEIGHCMSRAIKKACLLAAYELDHSSSEYWEFTKCKLTPTQKWKAQHPPHPKVPATLLWACLQAPQGCKVLKRRSAATHPERKNYKSAATNATAFIWTPTCPGSTRCRHPSRSSDVPSGAARMQPPSFLVRETHSEAFWFHSLFPTANSKKTHCAFKWVQRLRKELNYWDRAAAPSHGSVDMYLLKRCLTWHWGGWGGGGGLVYG